MTTPQDGIPRDPADNPELVAAYQEVVERYRGTPQPLLDRVVVEPPAPVRRTRPWVAGLGVLGILFLGYLWGTRPAWLFNTDQSAPRSTAQEDQSLRLGLYLEYHRVMEYRQANGKVPAALEEAGDVEEGVGYLPTGDSTFRLTAANERLTLELDQSDNPETVLEAGAGGEKVVP